MSRVAQMALLGTSAASPATLAFQAFTINPTEGQTITFTGVAIGAAAPDRYVFITIPYYNLTANNMSIASVTIGGVLATIHSQPFQVSLIRGGCALVSALVPTGTTADVVISYAVSGTYRPRIGVYRVTGLQSNTPFHLITDTNQATSNTPRTFTVNTAKDGFVLLGCNAYGETAVTSRNITGLTRDYTVNPVQNEVYVGGGALVSSAGTLSATIDGGSHTNWCVVMASFR